MKVEKKKTPSPPQSPGKERKISYPRVLLQRLQQVPDGRLGRRGEEAGGGRHVVADATVGIWSDGRENRGIVLGAAVIPGNLGCQTALMLLVPRYASAMSPCVTSG